MASSSTPSAELDRLRRENEALRQRVHALENAEYSFWAMVDGLSDAIYVQDREGRYLLANPAMERLLGAPAADLVGQRAERLPNAAVASDMAKADQEVFSGQMVRRQISVGRGSHCRVYDFVKLPLRDLEGRVTGLCGVARDITDLLAAQNRLAEAEVAYRLMAEESPLSIMTFDAQGRVTFVNKWHLKHFAAGKHDASFFLGRRITELPGIASAGLADKMTDLLQGREVNIEDVYFPRMTGGQSGYQNIRGVPLYSNGAFIGGILVRTDATKRKQAEEQMLESKLRLQQLFENMAEGVAIYEAVDGGADFVFVDINKAGATLSNVSKDDVVGRRLSEVFPGAGAIGLIDALSRAWRTGSPQSLPLTQYKDDRITQWVENRILRLPSGLVVAIYHDTSQQRRAEAALRESESKYRRMVEMAHEGIWALDQEGTTTFVNPEMARMLGYKPEQILGRPKTEFIHPDDLTAHHLAMAQRRQGASGEYEQRLLHAQGREVTVLIKATPVFDDNGGFAGSFAMLSDITQHRRAEQVRKRLEQQLRQSQKMEAVGTLAGGIAHDFNNILSAVLGYAELAGEAAANGQDNSEELAQITAAAERARSLVTQMLTFSRRAEIHPRPLDFNRAIVSAVEMLRRTIPRMVNIELDLADGLPHINADPTQIEQVVLNLGVNASDAMSGEGQLTIRTFALDMSREEASGWPGLPAGRYVQMSMADNGAGMDKRTREQIFDPFFTTKGPGKGTGLGLSTVYGIVKGHGGAITCYSEPGHGAEFRILMPAYQAAAHQGQPAIKPADQPRGGKETLLVVDDEEPIREVAAKLLRRAGYTVHTAADGEQALHEFEARKHEVALVIMDLSMPRLGGQKALEAMLAVDSSAKVLISSGYSGQAQVQEALATGAVGYVAKPYSRVELLSAVRQALDKQD